MIKTFVIVTGNDVEILIHFPNGMEKSVPSDSIFSADETKFIFSCPFTVRYQNEEYKGRIVRNFVRVERLPCVEWDTDMSQNKELLMEFLPKKGEERRDVYLFLFWTVRDLSNRLTTETVMTIANQKSA